MSKNINFNLNIDKDDSDSNDFLICWSIFKKRPNKVIVYDSFSKELFLEIIESYTVDKNINLEIIPDEELDVINEKVLIKVSDDIYLSYLLLDKNNDNSFIHEICFFINEYDNNISVVNEILDKLDPSIIDFNNDVLESNLNMVSIGQSSVLEIEPILFKDLDDDIDLYYNSNTMKSINKLVKKIKKSDKGLSIIYGDRGLGKTSLIKNISNDLGKILIFIPNNLIESTINNPEFKKFLNKYPKSIIVLDDCEDFLFEYNMNNITVNNILQMIDGFISDTLEINLITIFNINDVSLIDKSLLSCNNLHDIIRIDNLDIEESNNLASHLGIKKKFKNKTKLIDIIKKDRIINKRNIGF